MEKFFLIWPLFLALTSLSGCTASDISESTGLDSHSIVVGTFAQASSSILQGSGTVRFTSTLPNLSSRSLSLKASLDSNISLSAVTAIFYSADASLAINEGIAISFIRSGASVNAVLRYNGNAVNVTNERMNYYFPAALDVIVEVHNDSSRARVLIWRRNMVEYAAWTADVDSDRSGDLSSSPPLQNGPGTFIGLILQNSTVTLARVDSQKILD